MTQHNQLTSSARVAAAADVFDANPGAAPTVAAASECSAACQGPRWPPVPYLARPPFRWANALFAALGLLLLAPGISNADAGAGTDDRRYGASTARPYEDVLDDVMFAITEHNFRITGGNEIGAVLSRRHDRPFPRSQVVHFCNLEYAREFIEIEPGFLLHMPCKIALYEHEGRVVVETRLLPEDDPRLLEPTRKVNAILKAIVDDASAE